MLNIKKNAKQNQYDICIDGRVITSFNHSKNPSNRADFAELLHNAATGIEREIESAYNDFYEAQGKLDSAMVM